MDRNELNSTLVLLKKGREKLVADFTHCDVDLYTDLFQYENSNELMTLARWRFRLLWITFHYELFDDLSVGVPNSSGFVFKKCILQLLEHFELSHENNRSTEWDLVKNLIEENISLLTNQFNFSNKDDIRYKKLVFARHKGKALFERIFVQALGEKK